VGVARATLGGLGALRGATGRAIHAVLAIALGVALAFAVQLVNHTALSEFAAGLATLSGDADLQVQAGRAGFAEGLYPVVARDPAVAVASPVLQVDAALPGRERPLLLVGTDVLRAAAVTPALVGDSIDRYDSLRPDTVFLSPAAASWLSLERGDTLTVRNGGDTVALRVAGTTRTGGGARLAVMDIAGLQDRFALAGRLTRIDVRLRPGFDPAATARRLAALAPPGVAVVAPRSSLESTERLTRAYRVNLDVLALVALFTGALLVFSTQALSVLRRRVPFALLRSLGLTRARLVVLVVGEGALLGLCGALLGIAGGTAIARAATHWFGVDLGAGFFRGQAPGIAFDVPAALLFAACGVAAAALGSLGPAREAARAMPAAVLKAGDVDLEWGRGRRPSLAVATLAAGALLTLAPPVFDLPLFGYLSIALLLLGTLRLLPQLSSALLVAIPVPRAPAAALALAQVRHAPAQATLSLAGIVAAVSLMAAMAIMVASFRNSLDTWLMQVLPADAYVRAAAGDTAWLPPPLQRTIAALPGVERVEFLRATSIVLDPDAPRVTLLARDIDPAHPEARLALVDGGAPTGASERAHVAAPDSHAAHADAPPVWISEAVADRTGWRTGDRITLPLAQRAVPFTVAGVWRDYVRQQGALVIARQVYVALTGDAAVSDAAIWLAPGATLDGLRRDLAGVAGADALELATPGELRATSLRIFDRTFAVTYALEAVAVVIGLAGLSSAFGALVLARRREFGVLRHLGVTRGQVGAMLGIEGLALGGIGVVVGLALGFVIALILIHVVNRQSFHWSMELAVPWAALAILALALLAAATLVAWLAGRAAMTDDAVRAVKEDW
jgi:putative ABC transport system permease protein